jgi:hypothetical protein
MGALEEGAETARAALSVAGATGARAIEADALTTLGGVLGSCASLRDAESALRRARDLAIEIGDDYVALRAWWNLLVVLDAATDLDACAAESAVAAGWAL